MEKKTTLINGLEYLDMEDILNYIDILKEGIEDIVKDMEYELETTIEAKEELESENDDLKLKIDELENKIYDLENN